MEVSADKDSPGDAPGRAGWNQQRCRAIELLARRREDQSLEELARQAGVRVQTLRRWLTEGDFLRALVGLVRAEICSQLPAAKDALLNRALKEGDRECLKIVLRIGGLLDGSERSDSGPEGDSLAGLSDRELRERARRLRELNG